jgi:hypothetical protein
MVLGLRPSKRPGGDDNLSHPRETRKWLAALPVDRPLEACRELTATINAVLPYFSLPDLERAGALVMADKWVGAHRIALLNEYTAGAYADRERERSIWETLSELQQSISAAYDALLDALRALPPDRKWRTQTPMLVTRRLAQIRHDAVLRTFHYERWIPRRWRQLHELYQWVREQKMHAETPTASGAAEAAPGKRGSSPETEYIRILLTQQLNQGHFAPRDTLRIQRWLAGWSGSLRLSRKARSAQALAIDTAGQSGLQLRASAVSPSVLWLDLAPLLEKVAAELDKTRRERSAGVEDATQLMDEKIALLQQLTALWSGEGLDDRPEVQIESSARMRAAFGLVEIEKALRKEPRPTRSTPGASTDIVEEIQILEVAEGRGGMAVSGGWLVVDKNPTACRLRGVPPSDAGITPGTLAAIREDHGRNWSIGVVRRMRRAAGNEVELTLQLIALNARRLTLTDPVIRAEVKGETVLASPEIMQRPEQYDALFLPPGEAPPALPGRSAIVGPQHYTTGRTYWCRIGHNNYTLTLKRALERNDDYVWAAIEVEKRQ